jgi:hypothetical protein
LLLLIFFHLWLMLLRITSFLLYLGALCLRLNGEPYVFRISDWIYACRSNKSVFSVMRRKFSMVRYSWGLGVIDHSIGRFVKTKHERRARTRGGSESEPAQSKHRRRRRGARGWSAAQHVLLRITGGEQPGDEGGRSRWIRRGTTPPHRSPHAHGPPPHPPRVLLPSLCCRQRSATSFGCTPALHSALHATAPAFVRFWGSGFRRQADPSSTPNAHGAKPNAATRKRQHDAPPSLVAFSFTVYVPRDGRYQPKGEIPTILWCPTGWLMLTCRPEALL